MPLNPELGELPATFAATRDALRALACYVLAPARKARTGRIGLRPVGDGFGTPPFDDGSQLAVSGAVLRSIPGVAVSITTVRAAAAFAGAELSPDPGVGSDLPPFFPDEVLAVDPAASLALGAWYAFGQAVFDCFDGAEATVSEAQLWPEHFDLAVTVDLATGEKVNVGFSPGDAFQADPYAYVGPHDRVGLTGEYWNAPFGAYRTYAELGAVEAPVEAALDFITTGLALVAGDS